MEKQPYSRVIVRIVVSTLLLPILYGLPQWQKLLTFPVTLNAQFVLINNFRRAKIEGDCSVLIRKPQPEDLGYHECIQFGVRAKFNAVGDKDCMSEHRSTRIKLVLLDKTTGEPMPNPWEVLKQRATASTAAPTTVVATVVGVTNHY